MEIEELDGDDYAIYNTTQLPSPIEIQTWNGRDVQCLPTDKHSLIHKNSISLFIPPEQIQSLKGRVVLLFDDQEVSEPIDIDSLEQILLERGYVFDRDDLMVITHCGFIKRIGKGIEKGFRKSSHAVTKSYKKTTKYVKEHRKEIIIGVAIAVAVTAGVGLIIAGSTAALESGLAAGAAAAASTNNNSSSRRKEEEGHSASGPDPENKEPASDLPHKAFDPKSIFPQQLVHEKSKGHRVPYVNETHRSGSAPTPPSAQNPSSTHKLLPPQSIVPKELLPDPHKEHHAPYLRETHRSGPASVSSHHEQKARDAINKPFSTPSSPTQQPGFLTQMKDSVLDGLKTIGRGMSEEGADAHLSDSRNEHHALISGFSLSHSMHQSGTQKSSGLMAKISDVIAEGLKTIGKGVSDEPFDPHLPLRSEIEQPQFEKSEHLDAPRPIETPSWMLAMGETIKNGFEMIGRSAFPELFQPGTSNKESSESENRMVTWLLESVGQTLKTSLEVIGRGMHDKELLEPSTPLDIFDKEYGKPQESVNAAKTESSNAAPPLHFNLLAPLKSALNLFSLDRSTKYFDKTVGSIVSWTDLIPPYDKSRCYKIEGQDIEEMCFTFINGMDNEWEQAVENAKYIQRFTANHSINGIYNHTNGIVGDAFEIGLCNYSGHSPVTQDLLVKQWTDFHEKNKDNPHAKLMHFCHSQGALHTKNALLALPKEIRDRIIVVAIAPATVIPKELCYDSFNYASERDFVPYGEVLHGLFRAEFGCESERPGILKELGESQSQIIKLKPHPNAPFLDHPIKSPTFKDIIEYRTLDYVHHKGQYP